MVSSNPIFPLYSNFFFVVSANEFFPGACKLIFVMSANVYYFPVTGCTKSGLLYPVHKICSLSSHN